MNSTLTKEINATLLHGDCLEVMKSIPDKSIDLVLTDPPYGTTACKWDTVIPFAPMWEQLHRIAKDNAAICLFGSEPFSSSLRMSNIKKFKYDWVWHKNFSGGFSAAKLRPMKYHEIISVFARTKTKYFPQFEEYAESVKTRFKKSGPVSLLRIKENEIQGIMKVQSYIDYERGKYPSSVQFFKCVENANGKRVHPTQKPVALLEYMIRTYTQENETVLDFTMGSGSTGVACKNLNRNFIGIEKDDKYFEIAKQRINGVIK